MIFKNKKMQPKNGKKELFWAVKKHSPTGGNQ